MFKNTQKTKHQKKKTKTKTVYELVIYSGSRLRDVFLRGRHLRMSNKGRGAGGVADTGNGLTLELGLQR